MQDKLGTPIGLFAIGVSAVGDGAAPFGYAQVDLASPKGLDIPAGATAALLCVEFAPARYRDDGSMPTAAIGMPLAVGEKLFYAGNLSALRFAGQAGALLNVLYYGFA